MISESSASTMLLLLPASFCSAICVSGSVAAAASCSSCATYQLVTAPLPPLLLLLLLLLVELPAKPGAAAALAVHSCTNLAGCCSCCGVSGSPDLSDQTICSCWCSTGSSCRSAGDNGLLLLLLPGLVTWNITNKRADRETQAGRQAVRSVSVDSQQQHAGFHGASCRLNADAICEPPGAVVRQ